MLHSVVQWHNAELPSVKTVCRGCLWNKKVGYIRASTRWLAALHYSNHQHYQVVHRGMPLWTVKRVFFRFSDKGRFQALISPRSLTLRHLLEVLYPLSLLIIQSSVLHHGLPLCFFPFILRSRITFSNVCYMANDCYLLFSN